MKSLQGFRPSTMNLGVRTPTIWLYARNFIKFLNYKLKVKKKKGKSNEAVRSFAFFFFFLIHLSFHFRCVQIKELKTLSFVQLCPRRKASQCSNHYNYSRVTCCIGHDWGLRLQQDSNLHLLFTLINCSMINKCIQLYKMLN